MSPAVIFLRLLMPRTKKAVIGAKVINSADDGLLLRKDLHALYDAGLMTISSDGSVDFDREVLAYYKEHCRKGQGQR